MFINISDNIIKKLEKNNTIKSEEREIYRFGIQQGLTILLNIMTVFVIGFMLDMLWQSLIFMVGYIPIRSFAGGYHARTPKQCYVFSILLMIAVLSAMKYLKLTNFICIIMLFISSVLVLLLAPIEDKNKPLDEMEQRVYRKYAFIIWILELAFTIICLLCNWHPLVICMTITLSIMAIMLILGKLKNMFGASG